MLFGRKQRLINRLLIVEDEPLVAFDNEHTLTEAGYEVVATVDRYRDAIEVLDAQPVDLILSDVALTGERSGIDLANAARERGVMLIFVTGHLPENAAEISAGSLAKPYPAKALLASLAALEAAVAGKRPKRLPAGFSLYGVGARIPDFPS